MKNTDIAVNQLQEQLFQVLLEEMSAYDYLNETIQNKQSAIVQNNLQQIEHLTGIEHVVVKKASQLTQTRFELMQHYFKQDNMVNDPLSLSSLISTISEGKRESWERISRRLHQTVADIQNRNSENVQLINSSLNYVRGMINLFLPREEFGSDLYTKAGNENLTVGSKNLLDCNA